jgi:hypothetical protein
MPMPVSHEDQRLGGGGRLAERHRGGDDVGVWEQWNRKPLKPMAAPPVDPVIVYRSPDFQGHSQPRFPHPVNLCRRGQASQ